MSEVDNQDCFMGYFPASTGLEFHAIIDGVDINEELMAELYRRVSYWTQSRGLVLGEGFTWSFRASSEEFPVSIGMMAPVIASAMEEETYGLFGPDDF